MLEQMPGIPTYYGGGSSRYGRTKVAYQTINHFAK